MQNKILANKKLRYIILMITSQFVLTVFVAYWLSSQYQNAKETLQYELNRYWATTASDFSLKQLNDNILLPIINNPDTVNLDHIKLKGLKISDNHKKQLSKAFTKLINDEPNNIEAFQKYITQEYPYPDANDSIKVTINNIYNIAYRYSSRFNPYAIIHFNNLEEPEYENLFKSMFAAKLKQYNTNIDVQYIPKDSSIFESKTDLVIDRYNSQSKKHELAVIFSRYFWHLIKVIMPQIIFAIILLCLSGFALSFTYRGYVKQMKLNTLRSDFINNITHELKIPVATAKAALEALRKFGLQADAQTTDEYLDMVNREMHRLDQLTERVLKHSVFEKGRQNLQLEEAEMNAFTQEVIASLKVLHSSKNVSITYEETNPLIKANIDKVYVEGIIKNLVDNSLKYGGENVSINIQLSQDKKQSYIRVSDNGPGIKKEYLDKVFDKFFRVPNGDKHNIKGFGLGLSFAALLMKQHNGSITVKNLKTGGCQFTLAFPRN